GIVDKTMRSIGHRDTMLLKNSDTYTYNGEKAALAVVTPKGSGRYSLFLVPGEHCVLSVTGGVTEGSSAFYTEKEAVAKAESDAIEAINTQFMTRREAGENVDSIRKELMPKYQEAAKAREAAILAYIKSHPSSNVSLALAYELSEREEAINCLTADVKNGPLSDIAAAIQADVDKENARKEAAKLVADGCQAPDFTLKDNNGKDLALSSLRGKHVVLDFWGSWCGWCIKGFPEMKKYYEKYKDRLEILGIDCNDKEEKWLDAIKKNELPWKHVFNPKDSDLTTKYAIQGFPTKIILAPNGKILKTVVGESPEFYTFLDELFK
ncbi:MAG: TlpA disulfide reductase family protein, partial [Prevotella sp.]|nr:TlpA disulfide reductase family protein [Prevotella sp.]